MPPALKNPNAVVLRLDFKTLLDKLNPAGWKMELPTRISDSKTTKGVISLVKPIIIEENPIKVRAIAIWLIWEILSARRPANNKLTVLHINGIETIKPAWKTVNSNSLIKTGNKAICIKGTASFNIWEILAPKRTDAVNRFLRLAPILHQIKPNLIMGLT